MKYCSVFSILFCILCLAEVGLTQETGIDEGAGPLPDSLRVNTKEELDTSKIIIPTSLCEAWGNVFIITAEDIEASAAQHVGDLLRLFSGSYSEESGLFGQPVAARFRGVTSRQIVVTLDGRPVNDPQFGGYDLNFISLDMIERIEIRKGWTTTHAGCGVVGGIINIGTKRVFSHRPYTKVRYETGDYGLRRTAIHFGKRFRKRWYLNVAFDERGTDGFRANDDYDGQNISGSLRYEVRPNMMVTSTLRHYSGDLGLPGSETYPTNKWRREDERTDIDISVQSESQRWDIENGLYFSDITSQGVDDSTLSHENKVYGVYIKTSILMFRGGSLNVGTTLQKNDTESSSLGNHDTHEIGVHTSAEFHPHKNFSLLLSGQYDDHSEYDARISPGVACGFEMPGIGTVYFSVHNGYGVPRLNDIYSEHADSRLNPEKSRTIHLGFTKKMSQCQLGATLFRTEVTDQIVWKQESEEVWKPFNVDTRSTGLELNFRTDIHRRVVFGSTFTYLDSEDKETGKVCAYCPEMLTTAWLQFSQSFIKDQMEWTVRFEAEHTGERFADFEERVPMEKYALLHARVTCRIQDLNLYVIFRNLTDTSYQNRAGYPMPGRTLSFGGSWELWD